MRTTPKAVAKNAIGFSTMAGIAWSLHLLWNGVSNAASSFFIYVFLFTLTYMLIRVTPVVKHSANARVLFWSIVLSTAILELGLRYGVDRYQGYGERNGEFSYICQFTQWRQFNLPGRDYRLFTNQPHDTLIDSRPEFSFIHTINSLGLRDSEPPQHQLDSCFVIVGLGDSFTHGVGTAQDSTWVKLLESQVMRYCESPLMTVNGGTSGSDVIFEQYKLEHLIAPAYRPDLVVFAINTSDINDLIIRGGKERFVPQGKVRYRDGPWWKYLYSFSYIWRMISHEVIGVDWTLYTENTYRKLEQEALDLVYSAITRDIIPFADSREIKCLFVFTPMEWELDNASFAYTNLANKLSADGVNVLDLHKVFPDYSEPSKDYYWDIDLHCNSNGYLLWSKAIADEIKKQGLIDC